MNSKIIMRLLILTSGKIRRACITIGSSRISVQPKHGHNYLNFKKQILTRRLKKNKKFNEIKQKQKSKKIYNRYQKNLKKTTKNNRVKHRRHGKGTLTSFSTNGKPSVVPVSLPAAGSTDSSLCPRPPASQSLSARTLGSPQSLHLFYEIAKEIIW